MSTQSRHAHPLLTTITKNKAQYEECPSVMIWCYVYKTELTCLNLCQADPDGPRHTHGCAKYNFGFTHQCTSQPPPWLNADS